MILKLIIEQILERGRLTVPDQSMDWEVAKILANYGLQAAWPLALREMPAFYKASKTFTAPGSGNTIALPSDCYAVDHIEIPAYTDGLGSAVSVQGGAAIIDNRLFESHQANDDLAAKQSTPKARIDSSTFELWPAKDSNNVALAGTIHYTRCFGYIDDLNYELSAWTADALTAGTPPVIPRIHEEIVAMYALRMARMRSMDAGDRTSTIETMLANFRLSRQLMLERKDPNVIYSQITGVENRATP